MDVRHISLSLSNPQIKLATEMDADFIAVGVTNAREEGGLWTGRNRVALAWSAYPSPVPSGKTCPAVTDTKSNNVDVVHFIC